MEIVRLPKLGKTIEHAIVTKIYIEKGGTVEKGDKLFEIEIDKASMDILSPIAGTMKNVFVETNQIIKINSPMALVADKNETVDEKLIAQLQSEVEIISQPKFQSEVSQQLLTGDGDINMSTKDLKLGSAIKLSRLQAITANKMVESKRTIPCFYLTLEVNATDLVAYREKVNIESSVKISYNDFIIKSLSESLVKFPLMTGQLYSNSEIVIAETIDIGFAAESANGLVVLVIRDADKKNIIKIAADSKLLIERAEKGQLTPADLEQGCFTVSNLGAFGVETFIPIVICGQCGILGIGQIADKCQTDGKNVVIQKMMSITLSVDHRIVNGSYAAGFLDFIKQYLQDVSNFENISKA